MPRRLSAFKSLPLDRRIANQRAVFARAGTTGWRHTTVPNWLQGPIAERCRLARHYSRPTARTRRFKTGGQMVHDACTKVPYLERVSTVAERDVNPLADFQMLLGVTSAVPLAITRASTRSDMQSKEINTIASSVKK